MNTESAEWVCYLLMSLDNKETYIGSTPDLQKRLEKHNSGRGAKRTKGKKWIIAMYVEGFHHKNACLSFESGWKRLSRLRNQNKLSNLNALLTEPLRYTNDTVWNRILDLIYFLHNITLLDTKYVMNSGGKLPWNLPDFLQITFNFLEPGELPWPYYVTCNY